MTRDVKASISREDLLEIEDMMNQNREREKNLIFKIIDETLTKTQIVDALLDINFDAPVHSLLASEVIEEE